MPGRGARPAPPAVVPSCLMRTQPGSPDPQPVGGAGPAPGPRPGSPDAGAVARRLVGDLPCLGCGYNLRGLSVRSVCPECGTPVRAAIVAAVDPYAEVLRPIRAPRFTAAGLVLWGAGAFGAAILTWALRLSDLAALTNSAPVDTSWAVLVGVAAVVVSGIGATALVAPHAQTPRRNIAAAVVAVVGYLPLVWFQWWIHTYDPAAGPPFADPQFLRPERSIARIVWAALVAAVLLGLRPNARALAARSLLLRSGRVDRQTMRAMTMVLFVGAIGDGLHLLADGLGDPMRPAIWWAGTCLIGVASMLFTVGLFSALVDCIRIAGVILRPPPAPAHVLGRGDEHTDPAEGPEEGAL